MDELLEFDGRRDVLEDLEALRLTDMDLEPDRLALMELLELLETDRLRDGDEIRLGEAVHSIDKYSID